MDTKIYKKTLVFAGTFEGHQLAKYVDCHDLHDFVDFCVATEYGGEVLSDLKGLSLIEGRLDEAAMEAWFREGIYDQVIDATHPYAVEVTQNLRRACKNCNISYVRLIRQEDKEFTCVKNLHTVPSTMEAVAFLEKTEGRILLTTGSKELHYYKNLSHRIVARVLPSAESLALCYHAGIPSSQIICMQGPFSLEMNLATMKQFSCSWLVTKSTGKPGGFLDKAALGEYGYKVLVIDRPSSEEGVFLEEAIEMLENNYGK